MKLIYGTLLAVGACATLSAGKDPVGPAPGAGAGAGADRGGAGRTQRPAELPPVRTNAFMTCGASAQAAGSAPAAGAAMAAGATAGSAPAAGAAAATPAQASRPARLKPLVPSLDLEAPSALGPAQVDPGPPRHRRVRAWAPGAGAGAGWRMPLVTFSRKVSTGAAFGVSNPTGQVLVLRLEDPRGAGLEGMTVRVLAEGIGKDAFELGGDARSCRLQPGESISVFFENPKDTVHFRITDEDGVVHQTVDLVRSGDPERPFHFALGVGL
jgi:hypothetical protein